MPAREAVGLGRRAYLELLEVAQEGLQSPLDIGLLEGEGDKQWLAHQRLPERARGRQGSAIMAPPPGGT